MIRASRKQNKEDQQSQKLVIQGEKTNKIDKKGREKKKNISAKGDIITDAEEI